MEGCSVVLTKTGAKSWKASSSKPVHLATHFVRSDGTWVSDPRWQRMGDVAVGGSVTRAVVMQAPSALGSYTLESRLVKEFVAWFPQSQSTSVAVAAVTPAYAAR